MGIGAAIIGSAGLAAAAIDTAIIAGTAALAGNAMEPDIPEPPKPPSTTTAQVGAGAGDTGKTAGGIDDSERDTLRRRKTGARGLQIPLATRQSTPQAKSPATTGINI